MPLKRRFRFQTPYARSAMFASVFIFAAAAFSFAARWREAMAARGKDARKSDDGAAAEGASAARDAYEQKVDARQCMRRAQQEAREAQERARYAIDAAADATLLPACRARPAMSIAAAAVLFLIERCPFFTGRR
jgi:hypothetical protein